MGGLPHKLFDCTFPPPGTGHSWATEEESVQLDLQAALERALAGHYSVMREIGRGGMAVVFQARDLIGERDVAIKLLYPDLARALGGERFLREIRILQQLAHPNILPLLDSGTIELMPGLDLPWHAMPLAREETLRARLTREGALPVETALGFIRDLCAALSHAHGQGVIHRDIKPENILLVDGHAVLADFGIARAITVAGGETLSTTGIVVGTPAYMSPEQSTGARQLDGRSDLYSLGVVLYETLAGHPPFSAMTPQAVSARHQFETPPPIAIVRPGLPPGVNRLLDRLLTKVPADRYQSAAEVLAAAEHAADAPTAKAKHRTWYGVLAGVMAIGLVVARIATSSSGPPLDQARYAVLPFQTIEPIRSRLLNGGAAQELVADILVRIPEHKVISTLTTAGALEGITSLTAAQALEVARDLNAGRAVWGQVREVADTILVTGILYDVNSGKELESSTIRLLAFELGIGTLSQRFAELTYKLVLPGAPLPETANAILAAKSTASWRLLATGDSALAAWNLVLADRKYREALELDPGYPDANLRLAQISEWQDAPAESWLAFARSAAGATDRLNQPDQILAAALLAMAERRYPAACSGYRQLIQLDSLSYQGWFGLGQCLTKDNIILPDSREPGGYRFRTSYREAVSAYRRGLTLVPPSYLNYAGGSLQTLTRRLAASPASMRFGRLDDTSTRVFPAYPGLEHDTLAYRPADPESVMRSVVPPGWAEALQRNRDTLVAITTFWVNRFPASIAAQEARAEALEIAGHLSGPDTNASALGLTHRLRRSAPPGSVNLAVREVRLLVKLGRQDEARLVAESTLAIPPVDQAAGQSLAALASLIGRNDRAADLLEQYGDLQFATPSGELIEVPLELARDANRLLAYAGAGEPAESLRVIQERLVRAVAKTVARDQQARTLDALLFQPSLLAYPEIQRALPGRYTPARIIAAMIRGDTASAHSLLDSTLNSRPIAVRGMVSPDFALLESRLLQLLGDTAGARTRLQVLRDGIPSLNADQMGYSTQTAAINRALRGPH